MDINFDRVLTWAPRLLGLAVALFLSLFALDALGTEEPILGFVVHLLPALVLLAVVAVAWRWEWVGAVAFIGLAILYIAIVPARLDWILVVAGPLLVVGALYLWSWMHSPRPAA